MYDFFLIYLTSMMKVHPLSGNREDQSTLTEFFKSIKAMVRNLNPKFFMSDCANHFYNAWISVFEGRPHKLMCTWHIDKAWGKKLT